SCDDSDSALGGSYGRAVSSESRLWGAESKRQAGLGQRRGERDSSSTTVGIAPSGQSLFLAGGSSGRREITAFPRRWFLGDLSERAAEGRGDGKKLPRFCVDACRNV